jgi:putative transposase
MRELQVLGDGHLKLDFADWKEFFEQELTEMVRAQLKRFIEQALLAERDRHMDIGVYEHAPLARRDYRNGFYWRDLTTRLGRLCRLRVPRTRKGFRSKILPRYQRRQEVVHDLIRQAFLRGISTRQVSKVLQPVLGEDYSAQTISNILRPLTAEVAQFHRAPLGDHFIYLFLDGVVLKVRDFAGQVRRRVVLVAYGVLPNGQRKIVAFQLTHAETENAWSEFLHDLFQRGLQGQNLKLIITDGGTGLRAALPLVYPRVPVQLCWAHKMRNIADKVARSEGSCVAQAACIYLASSRSAAQRAFTQWRQAWLPRRPRAVACVERDLDNLLNFFSVPEGHWKKVRTTNVIERAFREVRRRSRPISSFSNSDSCARLIYGVITNLNSSWERKPLPEFTQTC